MPGYPPDFIRMFWLDEIYALIVIVSCTIIYLKTKELYELSLHRGIKYFGYTFLFFGLSFFVRLLFPLFRIFTDYSSPVFHQFFPFFSFLLVYTGTMAVLSLIYSALWKRFEKFSLEPFYALTLLSLFIAVITSLQRVRFPVLILQAVLFSAAIIIGYVDYLRSEKDERRSQVYLLYALLFFSWIANVAAHFATRISLTTGLALYSLSIALFLIILYKVLKITHVE